MPSLKPAAFPSALAAALLLAVAATDAQASLTRIDFTASLQWGGVTLQPGTDAALIQNATTGQTNSPFSVSGYFVIDNQAPVTVGFSPASGYWSSDAFNEVSFTVGSKTFGWTNAPGYSNTRYGLTLGNSGTTDMVRTGSLSGPTVGGIDSYYFPEIQPQVVAQSGYNLFLHSMVFELYAPGLLTSNILADQTFDWGSINFGVGGDSSANSLLLQFVAATGDGLGPVNERLAQNASGRFTSFSLHREDTSGTPGNGNGTDPATDVPEPSMLGLFGLGLAGLLIRRRQR